jgi:hypothetical protein
MITGKSFLIHQNKLLFNYVAKDVLQQKRKKRKQLSLIRRSRYLAYPYSLQQSIHVNQGEKLFFLFVFR